MTSTEIPTDFWSHVDELRHTILRSLFVIGVGILTTLFFYKQVIHFLTIPFYETSQIQQELIVLGPVDGIMTTLKTAFWVGLVVTSPIWISFILQFIAPALKTKERKLIIPFLLLSLLFMAVGFLFAYTITIPFANAFLSTFNQEVGVNLWSLSNYLNYTAILLLGNVLAFELSIILLFLVHIGIVKAEALISKRRYTIVGAFVLSAILTPPDILTQIMLAIPLIGIYELAIIYAKIRRKTEIR